MRAYVSCLLFALVTAVFTPISAEAQLTDAECVAVHDSNGTRVGRAHNGDTTEIHLSHQGRVAVLRVVRDAFDSAGAVYFTGANCTGEVFMRVNGGAAAGRAHVVGTDVWYPDSSFSSATRLPASARDRSGACITVDSAVTETVPAFNFTLPAFTPPFHLEAEPCSVPPDLDPEQFINGCISKNGTLKIVADPADCTSRETPVTLLGP